MSILSGGQGDGPNARVWAVEEIQGVDGAFSFPEKLLQQIWQRGDFDTHQAATIDGRRITIMHPGRWNLLGGPDFLGARMRLGDELITGDVELHLHAVDWAAHDHSSDPAYANVILHVVLFPPTQTTTVGVNGAMIPLLALLPLLHHDLESYTAEAAVERLANHPLTHAHAQLAMLGESALRATLAARADARWREKIRYARVRIEKLGWAEACHHTALEILGYPANRAPMLAVAATCPLGVWTSLKTPESIDTFLAALLSAEDAGLRWRAQGFRPANHPRMRLRQYARWASARPDWPGRLASLGASTSPSARFETAGAPSTAALRKRLDFRAWRERFATELCAEAIGGSRLDTLIGDGFLPLLAARLPERGDALRALWQHWFVGDAPAKWPKLLRALGAIGGRDWPASHGAVQGLLGWLISEEKKRNSDERSAGRGT